MLKERAPSISDKTAKIVSVDNLRFAEYYGMQNIYDQLYARSKAGVVFENLMDIILSRENILLAYRTIKGNAGSKTPGTDGLTINDLGRTGSDEMVAKLRGIIAGNKWGYRPKPVRRKDIPKPDGSSRPLGIPCIWDRLVQQCIKQVLEPICEAKFSDNSYGFRPLRSAEHAVQAAYYRMQRSNMHYVIEFDIKGFFDHVDHAKLIRQVWAMGIHDKHLIFLLKQILKAPIRMPDGKLEYPSKGTPQGGIISPLLANVVLNELDHWIESQWQSHPVVEHYKAPTGKNGAIIHSNGYRAMRSTKLKEMYIVRYADDFRIFCKTRKDAQKTLIATSAWLKERLKLEVSVGKTRIVNIKEKYSNFLGFKMKVIPKAGKYVVCSHISDTALKREKEKLVQQAKMIAHPENGRTEREEVLRYDAMVMGIHNYYGIATNISIDCQLLHRSVMTVLTNRLRTGTGTRLVKTGRELTTIERKLYGHSAMLRYVAGCDEPIYPVGYVQHRKPMAMKRSVCSYTPEGRICVHDNLRVNMHLLLDLMKQPTFGQSVEYADNRLSLFSAQWGRCSITGVEFFNISEIHCHHIIPKEHGGDDSYGNLTLILESVHKLIHATRADTIAKSLQQLNLTKSMLQKVNALRQKAGNPVIPISLLPFSVDSQNSPSQG